MSNTSNTPIIEINGNELSLLNSWHSTAGYGHKKITVSLSFEGNSKEFYATTNNMPGFDKATDLQDDDADQYHLALYSLIDTDIESEVTEWIGSIKD